MNIYLTLVFAFIFLLGCGQVESVEVPEEAAVVTIVESVIDSEIIYKSSEEIQLIYTNHTSVDWHPSASHILKKQMENGEWEVIHPVEGVGFLAFNPRTFTEEGTYEEIIDFVDLYGEPLAPGTYKIIKDMFTESWEGLEPPFEGTDVSLAITTEFVIE